MNTTNQPNFLIIQADQLSARALPCYGNLVAQTPNLNILASNGTVFRNAYCNYPLCGPSRMSMMTGMLPFRAGAYDNGSEFAASIPTIAHYLQLAGYQTCLSGKMHYIGPDQLHGFEQRLTTDIYPSDFNWTANWAEQDLKQPQERLLAAAGEVNGVRMSGIYERTIQLDYDDEVAFKAERKIHDFSRSDDNRPFGLWVSFTHPHDPFAMPKTYWNRYRHEEIDMPLIGHKQREELDHHSQRLYDHIGVEEANMSDQDIRIARHGYYAATSYIDDQVGRLINALKIAGYSDNTVIIFLSDHGEALGERGLWFKRSFFDVAMKIPFIVSGPGIRSHSNVNKCVSLIDLLPTLNELALVNHENDPMLPEHDGRSLKPELTYDHSDAPDLVIGEMAGEAQCAPAVMIREEKFKFIYCESDPNQLYDLESDPSEQENLSGSEHSKDYEERMMNIVNNRWDMKQIKRKVLLSQTRRRLVDRAHGIGSRPGWDYTVQQPGEFQYFRPHCENPSASNYTSEFEVRNRPDSDFPNSRKYP